MSRVRCQITVSLDGYVAGPDQTPETPLGEGGESLHEWAFAARAWQQHHGRDEGEDSADSAVVEDGIANVGAYIMGRNMFAGPGDGPWDPEWKGWWGDTPPYHVPVYVLTHHARDPLPMEGGTTFHFVTSGIESALGQARAAAGERDVMVAGGASAVNQYLAAGLLDELHLHIAPIVLGGGARLLEGVGHPALTPVEVVASPRVTHVKYRIGD
jgi:dihydrofolate reductase